jgi:hypothetical protein
MANETNEQRWAARVAEWRASGLTAPAYCEGRDFTAGGLRHWAHVLKRRGVLKPPSVDQLRSAVRMVRVESTATAEPSPTMTTLTIELGAARLEVPAGFDASTLRTVLEVLASVTGGGRP